MFCKRRCCKRMCYRSIQNGDITIEELNNKIAQDAILLDVRSNQEYNEGHLQGAINIPDYELRNRVQREIPKKNQLVVIYCQYGGRSRNAYNMMKNMGYTNICNLSGGLDMI